MFLQFYILIIWTVATVISIIPLRRFEEEKERNGIDLGGQKVCLMHRALYFDFHHNELISWWHYVTVYRVCNHVIAVYSENKLQHYATAYRNHKSADQPGDDALEILLTGATFYKDINGVGIYVKRGDRLDAQMDWYLMKLRGMIHYTDGSAAAIVGTRHVSIHIMPARITISGRNSIIPQKVFYYRPQSIQI